MEKIQRTVIVDALKRTDYGAKVNIKGWVRTRRGNKNVSFIALNDGSSINNIQIVADIAKFGEEYLKQSCEKAYAAFTGNDPAPLVKIDGKLFILELYHGPTCAFKDMALTVLPYLLKKS